MGRGRDKLEVMRTSQTLPPSPTHSSSSSSDFEFTVSFSPRKASSALCPADELFYKGKLLPLHLSPRLSMVRTILSSSSSSDTTASRDSTGSTSSTESTASFPWLGLHPAGPEYCCDSSRPSSVAEDDDFKGPLSTGSGQLNPTSYSNHVNKKNGKYSFSLPRFSSVFKKEPKNSDQNTSGPSPPSSMKRMSSTARVVICKYLKKVKPLYDKLSQKQQQHNRMATTLTTCVDLKTERSIKEMDLSCKKESGIGGGGFPVSFSGNLRYPRRKRCPSSCPSSMRSSPSHSGVLSRSGFLGLGLGLDSGGGGPSTSRTGAVYYSSTNGGTTSSMEELQNAIQGAIAHCKNSMSQKKRMVSNEI